MASIVIANDFAEQLAKGVHQFGTHTIKMFLTTHANAPDAAADAVLADITPIAYTNMTQPTVTVGVSNETDTILSSDAVVITASGGSVATFRWYGLYNDTATNDNLICWWDHGSDVTLATGETFTVNFNNDPTAGTIMTIGQGSIT